MWAQIIGWSSSCLLVLTIAQQVWKQWKEGASEGISRWLFLGQMGASAGFTTYSWLVQDYVFVVTNALLLVNGVLGYLILLRNRRRRCRANAIPAPDRERAVSSGPQSNPPGNTATGPGETRA